MGAALLGATGEELEAEALLGDEALPGDEALLGDEALPGDALLSSGVSMLVTGSAGSEDPVGPVPGVRTLAGVAETAAEGVGVALVDVSIANVSATSAASVAVPVAIRVRRVECMAPVVPGQLKTSVRAGLRAGEAGRSSASGRCSPIRTDMSRPVMTNLEA